MKNLKFAEALNSEVENIVENTKVILKLCALTYLFPFDIAKLGQK